MSEWRTDWKVGDKCFVTSVHRFAGFDEAVIESKTSRSWITSRWGKKHPKNTGEGLYDTEMVWASENKWKIADAVRSVRDPAKLRQIAELADYTEPPND